MSDLLHILLIDDSAGDRELVRRLLPTSWQLQSVASAAEARHVVRDFVPDVVLLDYRLPDADGTDLLPLFAGLRIPVVMLTGMEVTEIVVAAMQGGAQDYLVKNTLTETTLERVIANAIEKARLQRAVDDQQKRLARQAAALEAKNREISALARALTLAEQAERRRLSSLLHDQIQQLLFGAKLSLGAIAHNENAAERAEKVATAEAILDEAIATTRDLAVDLTPPVLDREELEVALRWVASHMAARYDLEVVVKSQGRCHVPARELRVLLVQLVRELLFNVVKHAETDSAVVRLAEENDHYIITVEDRGRGFDPGAVFPDERNAEPGPMAGGFGLHSVRERLQLLGGRLEIESDPGRGTRITISTPVSVGTVVAARLPELAPETH